MTHRNQMILVLVVFLAISLFLTMPTLRMALIDPDRSIGQVGSVTVTNSDFITLFSLFAATVSIVGFLMMRRKRR